MHINDQDAIRFDTAHDGEGPDVVAEIDFEPLAWVERAGIVNSAILGG